MPPLIFGFLLLMGFFISSTVDAHLLKRIKGKYFDRAIFVLLENTNYDLALQQPFLKKLATEGTHFSNFMAITHPSQCNYIALTSGDLHGVADNEMVELDVKNIVDLLEARAVSWKVYAEDYPGNCFLGAINKAYVRKHNPFLSYTNITGNPERCAHIVNADHFDEDARGGHLPQYVFYIPNLNNDGHDTGVVYADQWYAKKFTQYVTDSKFMRNTVLITTFDESGPSILNQIYTSFVGPSVRPGVVSSPLNLYSLLKLVEENWSLGNLGKQDVSAPSIPNIWR